MKFFERALSSKLRQCGLQDRYRPIDKKRESRQKFSDFFDSNILDNYSCVVELLIKTEYGNKILQQNLLTCEDMQKIDIGVLSWVITAEGLEALENKVLSKNHLESLKGIEGIEALKSLLAETCSTPQLVLRK